MQQTFHPGSARMGATDGSCGPEAEKADKANGFQRGERRENALWVLSPAQKRRVEDALTADVPCDTKSRKVILPGLCFFKIF